MKCPNGLNKTKLISFPRCGHHLLVRGLQWALQGKLIYSNYYNSNHNVSNCEFVNLQKSHDFDLDEPISENYHYIVLIRGFELAVESWHKVIQPPQNIEYFRESKLKYYDDFTEKWVLPQIQNKIVLPYNDLVTSKIETILKAVNHISDQPIDDERMMWLQKWEKAEQNKRIYEKVNIY